MSGSSALRAECPESNDGPIGQNKESRLGLRGGFLYFKEFNFNKLEFPMAGLFLRGVI